MLAWVAMATALAADVDLEVVAEDFALAADTDRAVRRALHRMVVTYEAKLGLTFPSPTPVHVRLIADRDRYLAKARAIGLTGPTLGFFSPRLGEGVVWRNTSPEEMQATLLHEASHYLLAVGGVRGVPRWLNEGLAETFEHARTSGNAVFLDPAPGMPAWLRAHAGEIPALDQLLTRRAAWAGLPLTPVGGPDYGIGWAICAFLLSRDRGEAMLRALLQDPSAAARLVAEWPGGPRALDRAWRAWWRAPAPIQLPIPTTTRDAGESGFIRCHSGLLLLESSGLRCPD